MATAGLKLVLTIYGVFDIILPQAISLSRNSKHGSPTFIRILASIHFRSLAITQNFYRAKRKLIKHFTGTENRILSLPFELREQIYNYTCYPSRDGSVTGAHHLLLLNKQIRREALPIYERIVHKIVIGDLQVPNSTHESKGLPYIVNGEWYMTGLKNLVIEVGVCSLGTMTPDSFDVNISSKGKEQWRNLKKLIGIWPETREEPLRSIRLDLKLSKREGKNHSTYRADFIRILRNFKRTRIWAETGDCGAKGKNKSVLLPLVRAFNQGRRNWVDDSDSTNNLIVRYDKQVLLTSLEAQTDESDEDGAAEEELEKWSVIPVPDTSRTDNAHWPDWTDKEEKYVNDKMIRRKRKLDREWECKKCLAVFDCPRELKEHRARGTERVA